MKRRTKIVCTLGPAVASREKLKDLIASGMNVARLNCSHGGWDEKLQWIEWIRELSGECSPVAILADLQGPKFRIGPVSGDALSLATGQTVTLGPPSADLPVPDPVIFAALVPNAHVLLGDGAVELRIVDSPGDAVGAKVVNGGLVRSRQGLTIPGKAFDVPAITDKDRKDLEQAAKAGVDFIALSYVRSAGDCRQLRALVDKVDPSIGCCAKIETREALKEIDEIIRAVDLVMVARGDMGLQLDVEDVPIAQKRIIERCWLAARPVVVATQMLESMIHASRPTRAEASDVANAILDGADAVMLSGETATGEYPVECVNTMSAIATKAETLCDRNRLLARFHGRKPSEINHTEAVAHAVNDLAELLKPAAILTTSTSGQTPRLVSRFRPHAPILCVAWRERTRAQLAVVWGVESIHMDVPSGTDEGIAQAIGAFRRLNRLKEGDSVVITAGAPLGRPGATNLVMTQDVK